MQAQTGLRFELARGDRPEQKDGRGFDARALEGERDGRLTTADGAFRNAETTPRRGVLGLILGRRSEQVNAWQPADRDVSRASASVQVQSKTYSRALGAWVAAAAVLATAATL